MNENKIIYKCNILRALVKAKINVVRLAGYHRRLLHQLTVLRQNNYKSNNIICICNLSRALAKTKINVVRLAGYHGR